MHRCAAVIMLVPSIALADRVAEPPPQVKTTVDAFKGNWIFDSTVTAGDGKPTKFKVAFNCKAVAGGTAVACEGKAKTPMGPWDSSYLVAYDPYSKAVRFIGVTNAYEVRSHVCQWKSSELACAPAKGGSGPAGDEIVEEINIKFDKSTCTFTSKNTSKGVTTVFEGKGKK